MGKSLFIAEKPSVAMEFAKALGENMARHDGYQESDSHVVTWCVGHLVTMSYPEVYDESLKRWSLSTLPFIPDTFLYEVIPGVKKQFNIVKALLNRPDVDTIYICTDSGREGEYIYRLVAQMAGVPDTKAQKRVWIDSQTEEEIRRGIREAKDASAYDNLGAAAYLRAKEDYLMGINFSRLLTLKYGNSIANYLGERYSVISVGRVMTCVLGMIVRREREIRSFVETPFYRVLGTFDLTGTGVEGEWRAVEGSAYYQSPKLYKENGFLERKDAEGLIAQLGTTDPYVGVVEKCERKKEKKNPPLLYNLAEIQNDASRMFKISPDQTLNIIQELYEKKLVTYPRTDARVLSTAVAKVIRNNISGLRNFEPFREFALDILERESFKGIEKTRYVNDKQITDHYAIIPTGQGLTALKGLNRTSYGVYCAIVRRFLSIFYPPAEYQKAALQISVGKEQFFANFKVLSDEGYLVLNRRDKGQESEQQENEDESGQDTASGTDPNVLEKLKSLRKGSTLEIREMNVKEGKTSPPKRYNSGTMILAMENAGQLIEDDQLREQIKGSGIGTSATRAEILKKLVANKYIALNKKTQILTPTLRGEMIFDVVNMSIRSLLNPELTASWEKGLNYVSEGSITPEEYMTKLNGFIVRRTEQVLALNNQTAMRAFYDADAAFYKNDAVSRGVASHSSGSSRGKSGTSSRRKPATRNDS